MNFRTLQYFLTVAEERSITRAAKKLYISQQSLSSHIAKLEEELGVQLFDRAGEMRPTYAGERLMLMAGRVCALEQEIRLETADLSSGRRSRLRIGATFTCGLAVLPHILPEFSAGHPDTEISLMEGSSAELNEWLRAGKIDVMISYAPVPTPGAKVTPILRERLLLACPREISRSVFGERREGEELDISRLAGKPFVLLKTGNRVRSMFDAYTAGVKFLPNIILEADNVETTYALAARGMGVTVYPEMFLHSLHRADMGPSSPLEFFPLPGESTVGTLAVAYPEGGYHSRALMDFAEACRSATARYFPEGAV